MTRWQERAYRLRRVVLVLAGLCLAAGLFWVFSPLFSNEAGLIGVPIPWIISWIAGDSMGRPYLPDVLIFLGLFFAAQWFFLGPAKWWHINLAETARPMKRSVVIAACAAMLITVGFFATLLGPTGGWAWLYDFGTAGIVGIWIAMLLIWAGWGVVFFIYWRGGDRCTQLTKMIRGIIAGSILEMLIATGVFALNPRNEECYCARGSYTGLIFGGTALLWAFGPGVILLYMRERDRRQGMIQVCGKCGYDLRGNRNAKTCPECGAAVAG